VSIGFVLAMQAEARAMLGRGRWKGKRSIKGEARPCVSRIKDPDGRELITTLCGVGPDRVAEGTGLLLDEGVNFLIGAGISGGLSPDLKAGDLVLAGKVIDENGAEYEASREALGLASKILTAKSFSVRQGPVISTKTPLFNGSAKKKCYEKTGALAVDMESAGMASVASRNGRPFFIMRAVCDEAEEAVSADLYACLDENSGAVRPGQLLGSCLKRPAMVREVMRLRRPYNLAITNLGRGWKALVQGGFLSFFASLPGGQRG